MLRFIDGFLDGLHRAVNIDNHTLPKTFRGVRADPDDINTLICNFTDNDASFCGSQV